MNTAKIVLAIWNIFEIIYITAYAAAASYLSSVSDPRAKVVLVWGGIIAAVIKGCDATITAQLNQFIVNRGGTESPAPATPQKPLTPAAPVVTVQTETQQKTP